MNPQELLNRISQVDPVRLEAYHRMFDRMLLYMLAVNTIPQEGLESLLQLADTLIKKTIDTDSINRTNYLQGSKEGRKSRMQKEPDGEDVRLAYLKTWDVVKDILKANIIPPPNQSEAQEDC